MTMRQFHLSMVSAALILGISAGLGQPGESASTIDRVPHNGGARMLGLGRVSQPAGGTPLVAGNAQRLSPRILTAGIRHRVPQDFATIQAAIDASTDGDTVLVSESTYLENIRYRGKAIVVGSLYLIDGDTAHIGRTIIDGSSSSVADSGSTVYFIDGEDTTSVLCGLTIQGGTGTRYFFENTFGSVWLKVGGGILCDGAGARIVRNVIMRNRIIASVPSGGGIEAVGTSTLIPPIIVEGNRISDNYLKGSSTDPDWGWVYSGGADFTGVRARIVNNVFERDTAEGYAGAGGGGLSIGVLTIPTPLPTEYIQGNVFRSNVVKAIYNGAVGAGILIYSTASEVIFQGNRCEANVAVSTGTWAEGGGLCVTDQALTEYGEKMILGNYFMNNHITCSASADGGGLQLYKTLATVTGNTFTGNAVTTSSLGGAGISAIQSAFRVQNNIFTGNASAAGGGAILITDAPRQGGPQQIVNNTIVDNYAFGAGGALLVTNSYNPVVLNNIFWSDTARTGAEISISGSAIVQYCDIQGGWPGAGNINADPRFVLPRLDSLWTDSPCIGAGTTNAPLTDIHGHPRPQPAGSSPDIGAEESLLGSPVSSVAEGAPIPLSFGLSQNYPNPFNPKTVVSSQLPVASNVKLIVHDVLGRQVAVLVNERRVAGYYQDTFDATGLSSGIYFYRLSTGSFAQTRKMLLVK